MDARLWSRLLAPALAALCLMLPTPAGAASTGTAGPTFTGASAPTGQKPQSKLWFNDGTWWAILYDEAAARYEIFRDAAGDWTPTGAVVDTRHNMYVDALWDGAHLNVLSAGFSSGVRFSRFTYDAAGKSYTRDVDPVTLTGYGVEAAVLDRDATGELWATWTHDSDPSNALTVVDTQVEVAHTLGDDATWSAPAALPVANAQAVTGDDISAVVHYAGHIGVMYSNQSDWTFTFASHADGAPDNEWSVSTALQGTELSDDHLNVKALDNDPAGQVFAAVKTSLNAGDAPLVELLVLDDAGAWHQYPVFTVADAPTRPQVMLDPVRRQVHVFAAMGPCCNGGTIAVKTSDLDAIGFAPGGGTTLIDSDPNVNNPTTTKQPVDAAMPFLPVLAGSDTSHRYWQATLALDPAAARPPAGSPPAASRPAGTGPAAPSAPQSTPVSPGPVAVTEPGPTPRALLSRLRLRPSAFRARGTIVFTLDRAARVTMRIERRGRHGWVRVRTRPMDAVAGVNHLAIRGRGRRPGRYRIVAWVAGRPHHVATFRILR